VVLLRRIIGFLGRIFCFLHVKTVIIIIGCRNNYIIMLFAIRVSLPVAILMPTSV